MRHEEFLSLPDFKSCHMAMMKIGEKRRDGACFVRNGHGGYVPDVRMGYVIERVAEDAFRFEEVLITDLPPKYHDVPWPFPSVMP